MSKRDQQEENQPYQISVLFRRNPKMTITPSTQTPQLHDLGVLVLDIILDREPSRIVYSHIAPEPEKDPRYLIGE